MIEIKPVESNTVTVDGDRWKVTETGELHVYKQGNTNEPAASFARGTWLYVKFVASSPE